MKLTKAQLRRILRRTINESATDPFLSGEIYPRTQEPTIANANADARNRMIDIIADTLCNITGLTPHVCDKAAEEIVAQMKKEGLC